MKDFGKALPCWQALRMGDGRMISLNDICPEGHQKTFMRRVRDVSLAKIANET